MRLFIGIEIPQKIKDQIAAYVTPLKKSEKGWEHSHDYHFTLLFIGQIDPEHQLEDIKRRMHEIKFTPFEIELGPLQFFNRRVLYVSVLPSEKLLELKNIVEKTYPEFLRPNQKEFVPHLTVKRWQRYEYNELKSGLDASTFHSEKIQVNGLALFKSEKDSQKRKYHVVWRTALED